MLYVVSGEICCLFSDKYKIHKYSVGRACICWLLKWWCITWPVGCKSLNTSTSNVMLYFLRYRWLVNIYEELLGIFYINRLMPGIQYIFKGLSF